MAVYEIEQKEPAPLAPSTSDSSIVSDNGDMMISFVSTEVGNAVEIRNSDGQFVRYIPQEIKYIDRANGLEDVLCDADSSVAAFVVRDNQVYYDRHFDGVTESWTIEAGQLKHNLTLNLPQRAPAEWIVEPWLAVAGSLECSADLHVRDLADELETDSAIQLIDSAGRVAFTLPPIYGWDQAKGETGGIYLVTPLDAGRFQLTTSVDNSWLTDSSRQYPVVIDPTVVSASPAALSNGGDGKKIVELSDGTLIAGSFVSAVSNNSGVTNQIQLSKSADKGLTWTKFGTPTPALYSCLDFSIDIDSSNNIFLFYCGHTVANDSGILFLDIFNPTGTRTLTSKSIGGLAVGGWSGALPSGASVNGKVGKNGVIYGGISTPRMTNACNTYVVKSTDGGNTWTTILTQETLSQGNTYTSVCLIPDNAGNLHIFYFNGNQLWYAKNTNNTSTLSTNVGIFVTGVNSIWIGICGLIDNNGYLHLFAWMQETTTTAQYYTNGKAAIWEHLSKDGGSTWTHSVAMNPTFNVYAPTSALDPRTNDIYLFAQGIDPAVSSTYNNLVRSVKSGSTATWGSPMTITNNTTSDAKNASALWEMFYNNSPDAIRYIWADGAGVEYSSISLNVAPLAPTLTQHANFDATVSQNLTWTFNDTPGDTQSAYQLEIYDTTTNPATLVISVPKTGSAASAYNLAANALVNGKTYQWRVLTFDSQGAQSVWSAYSTFKCSAAPTVSVNAPGTVVSDSYTFSGSYVQAQGSTQKSYQFRLWNATGSTILQDSGEIIGTSNAKTFSTLANNTSYMIEFIATSQDGITSSSGKVGFNVAYTPPATPIITVTNDPTNARVIISWTNPIPTGTEPVVASNNVFRRKVGATSWETLAIGAVDNFVDYTCPAGEFEYAVKALSSAFAVSDYGIASVTATFEGDWVYEPNSGTQFQFLYNRQPYSMEMQESRKAFETQGGTHLIRRGPLLAKKGTLSALMLKNNQTPVQQLQSFDSLYATRPPFFYLKTAAGDMTPSGDALKVDLFNVRRNMPEEYKTPYAVELSVDWEEVK